MGAKLEKRKRAYRVTQYLRIDIISHLYKRGYSYRQIREEVMSRLDLDTYSLQTLHKDIQRMLKEWREARIENLDYAIQLELERLDDIIREAWEAWEKSKQDGDKTKQKQIGKVTPSDKEGSNESNKESGGIETVRVEKTTEDVTNCGDPRYLEVIQKALIERRKLLGLYSPDKHVVEGDMSFTNLLMQTGITNVSEG